MSLNQDQLQNLLTLAKKAALQAGKIISDKQGLNVNLKEKIGGENLASCVITEVDLKAQETILETLTPSLTQYNLGLLTEESTDDNSRFEKDYFWCIDPLDGTLSFSRDEDGYSTSIALVAKNGHPVIGVVFNPRSNNLYHALNGYGAFKNNSPFQINKLSSELTLLFDQSYLKHPHYNNHMDHLRKEIKKYGFNKLNHYPLGGAVMNGIMTIEMAPAVYYKFPKKNLGGGSLWDFAASSIIQFEAGGLNSDFYHQPLDLNRKDSTFMNHRGVIYCSSKKLLDLIPRK